MENSVIITSVTADELKEIIRSSMKLEIENFLQTMPSSFDKDDRYITRQQLAEKINASLPTADKYADLKIFKRYRIGTRILFKEREVDEAITKSLVISRKSKGKS